MVHGAERYSSGELPFFYYYICKHSNYGLIKNGSTLIISFYKGCKDTRTKIWEVKVDGLTFSPQEKSMGINSQP